MTDPYVICPHCGNGTGIGLTVIDSFLMGNSLTCNECHAVTDAWQAYSATINHAVPFLHDAAALFVGCKTAIFTIDLSPNEVNKVSFLAHGIPGTSQILRLNYTPQGPIHPVEIQGNDWSFRRGRDIVWLSAVPNALGAQQSPPSAYPVKVGVYVTFSDATDEQHSEKELSRAFAALAANEFLDMVIPATIAIEFSCKKLISDLRSKLALVDEKISDKDLLPSVVPIIAKAVNMPNLPDEITQKMRRLWGQRDKAAHTGHLHQPYTRASAGLHLAAAVFAFRYLVLLRRKATELGLLNGRPP